jgi:hypothetical protein
MEENHTPLLDAIDTDTLTPFVQKIYKSEDFQILNWQVKQLGGGAGNPVSLGLFRYFGSCQSKNEEKDWSIILKIIQSPANVGSVNMGEGEDTSHWNYWKREPLVYQSGLLQNLPNGLSAPQLFAVTEITGNYIFLWLEDIIEDQTKDWTLEQYAWTARLLGRLNGNFIKNDKRFNYPWLSLNRHHSWIEMMPWDIFSWDDPRALIRYRSPEFNSFRKLLSQNKRFLTILDQIPQTISHGDTYPTNFKIRELKNRQLETVALDWALTGITPIGDDLGQFVFGAITNLKSDSPEDIENLLFESYIKGLRDVDCYLDRQIVRFGYTATAAMRVGLFQIYLLSEEINTREIEPKNTVIDTPAHICFEEMMAEEAYNLIDTIQL